MYLRKVEGPRSITLPNGKLLTRADLPSTDTRRWVASRKAVIVDAVRFGLIPRATALADYDLSEDELASWEAALKEHGREALRTTSLQRYRQP